ncbi:MAG: ABC transporter substrate-binding protein [Pseudomonadota bacterium]
MRHVLMYGAALLIGMCGNALAQHEINLFTEEYAPYNWRDKASGEITGISTEIVLELMKRARLAYAQPVSVPWARGLALTANNANTCLFTAARVPERESRYRWIGPIGRSAWVLFARKADHIVLHSVEDARRYRIGTYLGDASVTYFRERGIGIDETPSDRLNPVKLQKGRIDLWSVGRLPGLNLLQELGMDDMEAVLTFTESDMYLACSISMAQEDVVRLNTVLKAMYADNTIKRIYSRFGYARETPTGEPLNK